MRGPSGGIPIGVQATSQDLERFRKDTGLRQVAVISSLTWKDKEDIRAALRAIEQERPQDDILVLTEAIIRFLQLTR